MFVLGDLDEPFCLLDCHGGGEGLEVLAGDFFARGIREGCHQSIASPEGVGDLDDECGGSFVVAVAGAVGAGVSLAGSA